MQIDPMTVVIDVSGGVVQAVLTDLPINVILVDWDNIEDGDKVESYYPTHKLSQLPEETIAEIKPFLYPYAHLSDAQKEAIKKTAVECYAASVQDGNRSIEDLVETCVDGMSIEEQLNQIHEDDDKLAKRLGFVPETGEPVESEDEED